MQLVNFTIDQGFTTLICHGANFDLHNNFNFTLLRLDEDGKNAEMIFARGTGDWIPKTSPNHLTLSFKNVSHYYKKEHDSDYPAEYLEQDGRTIDMIGFSYDDDEIMEGVTDNKSADDLPALLFVFVTGKAIKIVADSVTLLV